MSARPTSLDLMIEACVLSLRRNFPRCKALAQYDARQSAVRAAAAIPFASGRCKSRACPWPSIDGQWCRHHLIDVTASQSTLPSALGTAIMAIMNGGSANHHQHA